MTNDETNLTLERWSERADHPLAPLAVSLVGIVWVFVALYAIAVMLDVSTWVMRTVWAAVAVIPGVVAFRLKDRAMTAAGDNAYARGLVWFGVGLGAAIVVAVVGFWLAGIVTDFVPGPSDHP